jgi:hypothetical protein
MCVVPRLTLESGRQRADGLLPGTKISVLRHEPPQQVGIDAEEHGKQRRAVEGTVVCHPPSHHGIFEMSNAFPNDFCWSTRLLLSLPQLIESTTVSELASLTFHTKAADWAHATSTPDTTWPISGHPPGCSRSSRSTPVLLSSVGISMPQRWSSSQPSPDVSWTPFPHRSPRQSSANAAVGGLKPSPAGRLRGAKPSSLTQHHLKKLSYIRLLSAFVTHVDPG